VGDGTISRVEQQPELVPTEIEPSPSDNIEHITAEQLVQIDGLGRIYNAVAKWQAIYKIIFRHDQDAPCPFVLSAEDYLRCARESPQWILDRLSESMSSEADAPDPETWLRFFPHYYWALRRGENGSTSSILHHGSLHRSPKSSSAGRSLCEGEADGGSMPVNHGLEHDQIQSATHPDCQAESAQVDPIVEFLVPELQ
jgi:hypothetical protein